MVVMSGGLDVHGHTGDILADDVLIQVVPADSVWKADYALVVVAIDH